MARRTLLLALSLLLGLLQACTLRPRNVRLILDGDGVLVEPAADPPIGTSAAALRTTRGPGRTLYLNQAVRIRPLRAAPEDPELEAPVGVAHPEELASHVVDDGPYVGDE